MKKVYTSLFAIGMSVAAVAQPTIQAADYNASVGEGFDYQRTNYVSEGSGGANQTWDLSAMSSTLSSTLTYTSPNASFPSTTVTAVELTGGENYYEFNSSGQYWHGFSGGGTTITYSNPMMQIEFPLSMNASGNDTHAASFVSGGYNFTRTGTSSYEVDGYGTVITPNGTYTDVLRVHHTEVYTDTYSQGTIDYDVDIYMWIKAGIHHPIASVTTFTTSVSGTTSYGIYLYGNVGLEEANDLSFMVAPNPAQDVVNIHSDAAIQSVVLTDLSGKTIIAQEFAGATSGSISVNDLQSGVYLVSIVGEDGRSSVAQRIVKQ